MSDARRAGAPPVTRPYAAPATTVSSPRPHPPVRGVLGAAGVAFRSFAVTRGCARLRPGPRRASVRGCWRVSAQRGPPRRGRGTRLAGACEGASDALPRDLASGRRSGSAAVVYLQQMPHLAARPRRPAARTGGSEAGSPGSRVGRSIVDARVNDGTADARTCSTASTSRCNPGPDAAGRARTPCGEPARSAPA